MTIIFYTDDVSSVTYHFLKENGYYSNTNRYEQCRKQPLAN